MPAEFKVNHGHWGEVYVGATRILEVTAIEYTIEIEQVEVPQSGGRWLSRHPGMISGNGELTIHFAYSDFAGAFLPYVAKSPDQLRAERDAGLPIRPTTTIKVAVDDPHGSGREYETLTNVQFWTYTGGFDVTSLVGRTWPFTFEGIIAPPDSRIARPGGSTVLY